MNEFPAAPESPTSPAPGELREKLQSDRDAHRLRNGKIAALPPPIREQLNRRLEAAEPGPALLDWLNAQPEVLALLQKNFGAVPVSKQNLSAWRQGGYLEWQMRQELTEAAETLDAAAQDVTQNVPASDLANSLAAMLTAQYARLLNHWDGEPDPKFVAKLQILRRLARDVALLQKCFYLADKWEAELEEEHRQTIEYAANTRWRRLLAGLDAADPSDHPAPPSAQAPDPSEKPAEDPAAITHDRPLPKKSVSGPYREAGSSPVKPSQGDAEVVPPVPSPSTA